MLSISKAKSGGAGGGYYFKYYADHSDEPARWFGKGAKLLGLGDQVEKKQFNRLLEGFSLDGKTKLVQNAGLSSRQGFWDLTLSVPKSVSVLYMTASDSVRKEIEASIRSAMEASLSYEEAVAGFSRRGKGGKIVEPAALAFATFFHISSRADEPQLHFHCLLINVGVRGDGTTAALHTLEVFREKMSAGAIFQVQLAHELSSRLHVEIEPERVGFHVKGVPKSLCGDCSTRRHDIEAELKRGGLDDAVAAKKAALKTRGKKNYTKKEKLFADWQEIASRHAWNASKVEELTQSGRNSRRPANGSAKSFEEALLSKLERIPPQNQTRSRVLRAAARIGLEHGIDAKTVIKTVGEAALPKMGCFHRVEFRRPFMKAPRWNPARKLRLPVIILRDRPQRWGKIKWKQKLWTVAGEGKELRIQQRRLFPKAPHWSPFSKLALPAIHIGRKSEAVLERERELEKERSF